MGYLYLYTKKNEMGRAGSRYEGKEGIQGFDG
jgi:hypothetical protein